jgi:Right handed beta helix region
MLRQSLRVLTVAALAAAAFASPAVAGVTPIDACGILDKTGETYVLTRDLGPADVFPLGCFFIFTNRITIDLNGHTIAGAGGGGFALITDQFGATSTVVKNGTLSNFGILIHMRFANRATVRAVTALGDGGNAAAPAILLGTNSLVKDCVVQNSGGDGIVVGEGSQVEGCLVGGTQAGDGNHRVGILGAGRILVTRNTVIGNGFGPVGGQPAEARFPGIQVGANSTVTHNTVNENGADGIAVGQKSLVTLNTANDNGGDGIEAVCPSTVTYNQASDNGDLDFNFIGAGCFDKGNTSPDETGCLTGREGVAC